MIIHTIRNLRSPDWSQQISKRDLLEMMRESEEEWKVTPWQRYFSYSCPMRSYLVTSDGGGIYAIWFRRRDE